MTRTQYKTALTALHQGEATDIRRRSAAGKPQREEGVRRLLTIGLLLGQASLFTPGERAEIHEFLTSGHV